MTSLHQNNIMKRLVLVKQVYLRAHAYALDYTELERMLAIQMFDYAVETLLKTVLSKYGQPSDYHGTQAGYYNKIESLRNQRYSPKMDFYRLWDEVLGIFRDPDKKIGVDELPQRREMDLLHKHRDSMQHDGVIPSLEEVQRMDAYVVSFIREIMKAAFNADLDLLTLSCLIQDESVRNLMMEAEVALSQNRFGECINASAKAFKLALLIEQRNLPYRRRISHFVEWDVERIADKLKTRGWPREQLDFKEAFRELGRLFRNMCICPRDVRRGYAYL
jgi:hypothetical protein